MGALDAAEARHGPMSSIAKRAVTYLALEKNLAASTEGSANHQWSLVCIGMLRGCVHTKNGCVWISLRHHNVISNQGDGIGGSVPLLEVELARGLACIRSNFET